MKKNNTISAIYINSTKKGKLRPRYCECQEPKGLGTGKGGEDMDKNAYRLADINDNQKVKQRLTEYEKDIAREIGGNIVLIAYQREDGAKD